jgi:maltooligosyltrehalose synthase
VDANRPPLVGAQLRGTGKMICRTATRNIFFTRRSPARGRCPVERAQAYMDKAARESKRHTTWTNKNDALRNGAAKFHRRIAGAIRQFTADVGTFYRQHQRRGGVNSLAQTLIKLTAPGVPDIYQGCDLWDFSLVDPDNRRPVDFAFAPKICWPRRKSFRRKNLGAARRRFAEIVAHPKNFEAARTIFRFLPNSTTNRFLRARRKGGKRLCLFARRKSHRDCPAIWFED